VKISQITVSYHEYTTYIIFGIVSLPIDKIYNTYYCKEDVLSGYMHNLIDMMILTDTYFRYFYCITF